GEAADDGGRHFPRSLRPSGGLTRPLTLTLSPQAGRGDASFSAGPTPRLQLNCTAATSSPLPACAERAHGEGRVRELGDGGAFLPLKEPSAATYSSGRRSPSC